jgi:hypothetical protein
LPLSKLLSLLNSTVLGYGRFLEDQQIAREILDEVYHYDLWTMDEAEKAIANTTSELAAGEDVQKVLTALTGRIDFIEKRVQGRVKLFNGEEPEV